MSFSSVLASRTATDDLLSSLAVALLPNVGAPSPLAAAGTLALPVLLPSTLPSTLAGLLAGTERLERLTSTTLVAELAVPDSLPSSLSWYTSTLYCSHSASPFYTPPSIATGEVPCVVREHPQLEMYPRLLSTSLSLRLCFRCLRWLLLLLRLLLLRQRKTDQGTA